MKKIHEIIYELVLKYMGVNRNGGIYKNGESRMISKLLNPKVIFDVGANNGLYTKCLSDNFPKAKIYAFEPMKENIKIFKSLHDTNKNILLYETAVGSDTYDSIIKYPKCENGSALPSLYNIFDDVELEKQNVKIIKLDNFCNKNNIKEIDFLKIDVEGGELEVLKGAKDMINDGKIKIISFEFNFLNAIMGIHMEDFRKLLIDYDFYRICPKGLLKLNFSGKKIYTEIYGYQNIIAKHSLKN